MVEAVRSCATRAPVEDLLDRVDVVVFDMDGVLWTGEEAIAGSADAIRTLMDTPGKTVLFMTNNSSKTRDEYVEKLARLGFGAVEKSLIYTSAYATGLYLQERKFEGKVFAAAGDGLCRELRDMGFAVVGGPDYQRSLDGITVPAAAAIPLDADVGCVVAGFTAALNYGTLTVATRYLLRGAGGEPGRESIFLSTNGDRLSPVAPPVQVPAGGVIQAALEHATSRRAFVAGKPSQFMLDAIMAKHLPAAAPRGSVARRRALMVGDRLDTDVAFGAGGGMQTLLVLSGCTLEGELEAHLAGDGDVGANGLPKPTYFASSIAAMTK